VAGVLQVRLPADVAAPERRALQTIPEGALGFLNAALDLEDRAPVDIELDIELHATEDILASRGIRSSEADEVVLAALTVEAAHELVQPFGLLAHRQRVASKSIKERKAVVTAAC
jgi:hypothetical protein